MTFRPLDEAHVRWRPLVGAGLEHLTVRAAGSSILADGVVIGDRGGVPYGVHYRLVCDPTWTVRSLDLVTTARHRLQLRSNGQGRWVDHEEQPLPDLDGCIDIDLAGTPFTNTLPIRRLALAPEVGAVELAMAYIPFDTFVPTQDGQRYRCLEPDTLFRYEAVDRSFAADLPVDLDGLVIDYPTLFERIEPATVNP